MPEWSESRNAADWLLPLRAALDMSSDAALFVDPHDLRVLEANQSAATATGVRREELLAMTLPQIAPEALVGQLAQALARVTSGEEAVAAVETFHRRSDGSRYPVESIIRRTETPDGQCVLIVVARDLSDRHRLDDLARQDVHCDRVTGLPNRATFERRLWQAIDRANRCSRPCAVFFIDVDHFKRVNDTRGHAAGDRVLLAVAERLVASVRPTDLVARYGGDEFTALVGDVQHEPEAIRIAERMQGVLRQPVMVGNDEVRVTASIGVALSWTGYVTAEELVHAADRAMYEAKACGRDGRFVLHRHCDERTI